MIYHDFSPHLPLSNSVMGYNIIIHTTVDANGDATFNLNEIDKKCIPSDSHVTAVLNSKRIKTKVIFTNNIIPNICTFRVTCFLR